jgi:hypothetical protein
MRFGPSGGKYKERCAIRYTLRNPCDAHTHTHGRFNAMRELFDQANTVSLIPSLSSVSESRKRKHEHKANYIPEDRKRTTFTVSSPPSRTKSSVSKPRSSTYSMFCIHHLGYDIRAEYELCDLFVLPSSLLVDALATAAPSHPFLVRGYECTDPEDLSFMDGRWPRSHPNSHLHRQPHAHEHPHQHPHSQLPIPGPGPNANANANVNGSIVVNGHTPLPQSLPPLSLPGSAPASAPHTGATSTPISQAYTEYFARDDRGVVPRSHHHVAVNGHAGAGTRVT